jgi:Ca-activated chloride channel homolog
MRTRSLICIFCLLGLLTIAVAPARADGVMRSTASDYPRDFLRHRMTSVDVTLYGQIALTTIEQEFVNEWNDSTDAVYSFPLPADARATEFLFWVDDTLFRAPLKVKDQAPNPGTGEGGIAAQLTNYLGPNALRVFLQGIAPGRSQRIILKYISFCRYDHGRIIYRYPLDTDMFLTYPLDELAVSFHIHATDDIAAIDPGSLGTPLTTYTDSRHADVMVHKSKLYLTADLVFSYTAASGSLSHDFFASKTASRGGHFVFVLKSPFISDSSAAMPKDVVFLLNRSSAAAGAPLELGKDAIKDCIDRLHPTDRFNIIGFNSFSQAFRVRSVTATSSARDSAKIFLDGLTATGYGDLRGSLSVAFSSFALDSLTKVMLMFTDGLSYIQPNDVRDINRVDAAVFPVAIGLNPARERLDAIAYANFGFPLYLLPGDPVVAEVQWLFDQVSAPIMKDARMETSSNMHDMFPRELRTVYAGSRFFVTGKYTTPTTSGLAIAGQSSSGPVSYSTFLTFPGDSTEENFVEKFWAKEKLDALERTVYLTGATDSLKQQMISISLAYGIRCMYTAYVAERTDPVSDVEEPAAVLESFTATASPQGMMLSWSFLNGANVREVHVLRADRIDGEYVQITTDGLSGTTVLDTSAGNAHWWYRLEIVTMHGDRILTSPVSGGGEAVPLTSELMLNYPNPFNPTTSIAYAVGVDSRQPFVATRVRLGVYDMLGREVAVLVDERKEPGVYTATWNAAGMASGVYIYRLTANDYTQSRTMVLLK